MNFEELAEYYNRNLNQTQNQINNLATEKQNAINEYETGYNNQLQQYNDLQAQQQNYIDTWAANQKEQQQKQTDYNIGLIEQNKKEAAEETQKQTQDAYVDYMKQTNQYGGALENLASRGLATQGYAESSKVAMYNTYQNRVSTANAALVKANTDYDNQIQQALINNDAALAETALEQMKQSYALALQGFDYTSNLYNQRLSYLQNIENTYFDRQNQLQSQAAAYAGEIGKLNQYQEEMEMEREKRRIAQEQWEREFAEEKRQFNAQMNAKYSGGGSGGSGGSSGGGYTDSSSGKYQVNTAYYQGNYNPDVKYGTFSNGYQPDNVNGTKLYNSGLTVDVSTSTLKGEAKTVTQKVWTTPDGTLYYWNGKQNKYVKFTKKLNNSEQKTLNNKLKGYGFGGGFSSGGGFGGGGGGAGGF